MKKPETRLQEKIKKHLQNKFGGVWHKIHGGPYQQAGIGDLVGCCYGYYFNLEVKLNLDGSKYEPTELQQKEIDDVNKNGGCGACVKTPEQAEQVVREYLISKAICLPEESSKTSNETRLLRAVDGTRHRKNSHSIKNNC